MTVFVIETLKCSLGATQCHWKCTIWKLQYGFLFALHSNYGRIFSCLDTMHERDGHLANQTDSITIAWLYESFPGLSWKCYS